MSNNLFCLYAFGRISSLNQAIYCLLTLKGIYQKEQLQLPKILIYTDNQEYFDTYLAKKFEYQCINLDPSKLKDWKGTPPDNFRIKLKSLEHACENYPTGNIVLVDSDTFVHQNLNSLFDKISSGLVFFHADEGKMNENKTSGQINLTKHFLNNEYRINNTPFHFPLDLRLYNAGLIGLNGNKINQVKDAIKLHDEIFPQHKLYFAEQLSIIFELQKQNKILTAEEFIAHYWYIKELDELIERLLIKILKTPNEISYEKILTLREFVPNYKKFKSTPFKLSWKIRNKLIDLGLLHRKFRWAKA